MEKSVRYTHKSCLHNSSSCFQTYNFCQKDFGQKINLALFNIFPGFAFVFVGQENILIQYIAEK